MIIFRIQSCFLQQYIQSDINYYSFLYRNIKRKIPTSSITIHFTFNFNLYFLKQELKQNRYFSHLDDFFEFRHQSVFL